MPYVIISTQSQLEYGPTLVGDERSDVALMEYLGAKKERDAGHKSYLYYTPSPPRIVLNALEIHGYTVVACTCHGIGRHCECGPTCVGDEHSEVALMEYLGAKKEKVLGNNFYEYKTSSSPREVLNELEMKGYTVISCTGIGQTCVWTLHKPDTHRNAVSNGDTGWMTETSDFI